MRDPRGQRRALVRRLSWRPAAGRRRGAAGHRLQSHAGRDPAARLRGASRLHVAEVPGGRSRRARGGR